MMKVALVEGVRTPFAKAGTVLDPYSAQYLGSFALRALMNRVSLDYADVDEVIFGNVAQPMDAANISRVIALQSGFPESISAQTVARNCASGMQSISSGIDLIRAQKAELVVAGGTESMSNIPLVFPKATSEFLAALNRAKNLKSRLSVMAQFRPQMIKPIVALLQGLKDPFCGLSMGQTAEILAKQFDISRQEQDEFALRSHQNCIKAQKSGKFADEIVKMPIPKGKELLEADFGPREEQSLEALAKLKPYFDPKFGSVTVGNSCPITDGASVCLLASDKAVEKHGLKPLAWIKDYAYQGVDPRRMGMGPVAASAKLLKDTKMSAANIDLFEINEAFAAQVLSVLRVFENPKLGKDFGAGSQLGKIKMDQLNVNGGAIALGHPVGSSGNRIVLTLAKELKRRKKSLGLATLCVGGGQGGAIILEQA